MEAARDDPIMATTDGPFDLTRWDEEVYDDAEGAKLQTVLLEKTFEGRTSGTSAGRRRTWGSSA